MSRSVLKYHGGKSQLAKKHTIYEPSRYSIFGDCCVGGGSFLCVKDRPGVSEFANDTYAELTNFFRVLQGEDTYERFKKKVENTPFSQIEFLDASQDAALVPDVDRAHAFFVRNRQSRQGLETDFATRTRRLRRNRNENASAWNSAIDGLDEFRDRIRWVEIREMDVEAFIDLLDSPSTFFYVDPPYLSETRVAGEYAVEMTPEQHRSLLEKLSGIEGKFMLCGYPSEMYAEFTQQNGWNTVEFEVSKSSSSAKSKPKAKEIIWRNYK